MRMSSPALLTSHISAGSYFFLSFLLQGSIESNGIRLCLQTFQTALDFWRLTFFTPCLHWIPSWLLNCCCHNPFYAVRQNKGFVVTFKAKAAWAKHRDTSCSLSQCSLADGQSITEGLQTLRVRVKWLWVYVVILSVGKMASVTSSFFRGCGYKRLKLHWS